MKKFLTAVIIGFVLLATGFFLGMFLAMKSNIASIEIVNRSDRSIMTATVSHEKGSAIAANIKKNHKQRVRFFTRGLNNYSLKITFDNNMTIYSETGRPVKNGDTVREIVTDSTITVEKPLK
ncbi:MAG: hypothetical protein JXA71_18560 [Chitinispirillaceae bacterium]|nr:hypothetical protein [Chitinispirillaceae bacterium]